jgi:hypothetical protein
MKRLILTVVVANVGMFSAEARWYCIHNEASDSFSVSVTVNDPRVVITPLITVTDPSIIVGRREQPCGRGSIRREKRYEVKFQEGYTPPPGEEPFISFFNDKGKFRLVFFDENYAELHSDIASEIHDDAQRREYDHSYTQSDLKTERAYDGPVRHWIVFKPYVATYCYELYRFAMRSVNIYDALADNSWVCTAKEIESDIFLTPYQAQKLSWWSKLLCCCDCDD